MDATFALIYDRFGSSFPSPYYSGFYYLHYLAGLSFTFPIPEKFKDIYGTPDGMAPCTHPSPPPTRPPLTPAQSFLSSFQMGLGAPLLLASSSTTLASATRSLRCRRSPWSSMRRPPRRLSLQHFCESPRWLQRYASSCQHGCAEPG